jgi:GntR family transcriptional regulator
LDTSRSLPAYLQISEMLIREVGAGHLRRGQKLAPERDMAEELGVSVGTLRKALLDLETKGVLERRQGSGNYIKSEAAAGSVYGFLRLELKQGGGLPTADVLSVDFLPKPDGAPAFGSARHGNRIRRLRKLGGVIAAVEEIWLDGRASPAMQADDLHDSLYLHYKDQLGIRITNVEDKITLGQVPNWSPNPFPHRAGSTVGFIERLSWAGDREAIEFSRTWFDTDKVNYISRLG